MVKLDIYMAIPIIYLVIPIIYMAIYLPYIIPILIFDNGYMVNIW